MVTSSTFAETHFVWLDLSARTPLIEADMKGFQTNRIGLKCDSVAISTAKNIMSFPTPAVGIATGESVSLGLDMGMATKSITLSGIITEQTIRKQFTAGDLPKSETDPLDATVEVTDSEGKHTTVFMTAQEICQLIHSYVDSSFMQPHQNLNKLIILIPSRVGPKWIYHDKDEADEDLTIGAGTSLENCPLIPFDYSVRDNGTSELDAVLSLPISSFPKPIDVSENSTGGIAGFVRSFDTTFVGGQPFVEFSLSFEVAFASL